MTVASVQSVAKGLLTTFPRHLLPDGSFSLSDNLSLFKGALQFTPGVSKFNGGQVLVGNNIMLLDSFTKPSLGDILLAFTDARVYKFNTGTLLFEDITRTGPPITGPAAVGSNTGGTLGPGTYDVTFTYVNATGETTESPMTVSSPSIVGANGKVVVTLPDGFKIDPPTVTSVNIYARIHGSARKLQGNTVTGTFTITTIATVTDPPVTNTGFPVAYIGGQGDLWLSDIGPNPASPFIYYIATNGVDAVQVWDTVTQFRDLLGGTSSDNHVHFSKAIAMFQNCLFHLNKVVNGVRQSRLLQWSDAGLVEVYAGGLSGSLTLFQGSDEGVELVPLSSYLAAYRKDSIHLISFSGAPFFFSQRQVIASVGLLAARAVFNLDTSHIFLGTDNVYVFNGVDLQPIGDDIRDELFSTIDPANAYKSLILYDQQQNQLQLIVPSTTGGGVPDTWWLWNLTTGGWSGPIRGRPITGGGNYTKTTTTTWATATGTWATVSGSWSSVGTIAGAPVSLFGNTTMIVYLIDSTVVDFDGVSTVARFESGAVYPGARENPPVIETVCVELLPMVSLGDSVDYYVGTAEDPNGPYTFFGPFQRGVRGLVKTKPIRGKWFVFAIQSSGYFSLSGITGNFQAGWTNP
jgi:hypothetical protein